MVDRLRFNIVLAFVFLLVSWLVLDKGGWSSSSIPLILIISLPLGLFFYTISPEFKKSSLFLPLSIFLIISFISAIFSVARFDSLSYFIYLFCLILIFFIVSQLAFSENHVKAIFYFFFGLTLVLSIISVYFFLTSELSGAGAKMVGTFYWHNPLAGFLLFGLPISLFLFWQNQNKRQKFWLLLACSLILSVFVLTYSKGGYLSLILPFFLLIWHFRANLKSEFFFKLILLAIFTSALVFAFVNLRKTSTYSFVKQPLVAKEGEVTSFVRFAYIKGALEIFLDNKLIGTGPATFGVVYPTYLKSPIEYSKHVHNFYLETLSETGIFGFLSFAIFVLGLLFIGFKLLKNNPNLLTLPIFAGLLGLLIHSGVDFDFSYPAIFLSFWFFAGLLYGFWLRNQPPSKPLKFTWLIPLSSFLLFIFGIFLFFSNYNLEKARNLETEGSLKEAKIYYQKSPNALFKNPQIYYYLGRIEYTEGNLKEAEKLAQKAVLKNPVYALNYQLLGRIYLELGDLPKAEENFKKAISLNPKSSPDYYIDLAELYLKMNQKDKAKEVVESILPYYSEAVINTLSINKELPLQIETLKKILKEAESG